MEVWKGGGSYVVEPGHRGPGLRTVFASPNESPSFEVSMRSCFHAFTRPSVHASSRDSKMFTGIIEEVGMVRRVEPLGSERAGRRLTIQADMAPELQVDDSISIDGACQTVVSTDRDAGTFSVDTIEETLRKTTFGSLEHGTPVNLERALRAGDRLDGHFVQGHVDATGTIVDVEVEETDRLYTIRYDPEYAPYLIPVGSIAVDGISLTVARLEDDRFTVAIIPHTYEKTNVAASWADGAEVNLEFDLIGKYVARSLTASGETPDPEALAEEWLEE